MAQRSMGVLSLFLLSFSCRLFGETGPEHFVPLEVGNSWTYEHRYRNGSYPQGGRDREPLLLKPVEIPGYPHGEENPVPPDSLTDIKKLLTIEITHTEIIDGLEYFVFSGPDYSWPPNLPFFWAGKKVRLTEEGVVVFRLDGRDIPWFELNPPGIPCPGERPGIVFEYDEFPYSEYGEYEICVGGYSLVIDPETSDVIQWGRSTLPWSWDQIVSRRFRAELPWFVSLEKLVWAYPGEWRADFFPGYGMGVCGLFIELFYRVFVSNYFRPISATISGKTISHESVWIGYPWRSAVHPTSWGQLKSSFTKDRRLGK